MKSRKADKFRSVHARTTRCDTEALQYTLPDASVTIRCFLCFFQVGDKHAREFYTLTVVGFSIYIRETDPYALVKSKYRFMKILIAMISETLQFAVYKLPECWEYTFTTAFPGSRVGVVVIG